MNRVLDIGHNDFRLFFKHKSAYVWLVIVPLAFIYLMGFANRGAGRPSNHDAPVLIENADTGFLGRVLLDELDAKDMWVLQPTNHETPASVIRIPADFTANVRELKPARLQVEQRDNPGEADSALTQARLVSAVIALNGHLFEAAMGSNSLAGLSEAGMREVLARPNPVSLEAHFAGGKPLPSGFNFSLPGNLVMYVMMNLLVFGGSTLAAERRNGVIRRLMVHPVRRAEIVMGKIYGLLLLGVAQIFFFLVLGKFLFHVNLGANLPAVTLTMLVFAWVAASLGVLVASVVSSEDRVVGVCVLTSLLMAAIGGCWWPLEVGPPVMKTLALCTPNGWALEALHHLISFGHGFETVWPPLAVLAGFGAAANLLAMRFFRC